MRMLYTPGADQVEVDGKMHDVPRDFLRVDRDLVRLMEFDGSTLSTWPEKKPSEDRAIGTEAQLYRRRKAGDWKQMFVRLQEELTAPPPAPVPVKTAAKKTAKKPAPKTAAKKPAKKKSWWG